MVPSPSLSQPSPASASASPVRLDKWLWAVRLFKTRTAAADACRLGRVTLAGGDAVKPSRNVRVGEEFAVHQEFLVRRVQVAELLQKRVPAKLVAEFLHDLTPAEEIEKARARREENKLAAPVFAPGFGRPTKAQRRALEAWHAAEGGAGAADGGEEE